MDNLFTQAKNNRRKKKIILVTIAVIFFLLLYTVLAFFFGGNKPLISYGTRKEATINSKEDFLTFAEYRYSENSPQIWDSFCIELDVKPAYYDGYTLYINKANLSESHLKGRLAFENGIYYLSVRYHGVHIEVLYDSVYKSYAQSVSGSSIFSTFFEIEKTNGWSCSQDSKSLRWSNFLLWQLKIFLGKPIIRTFAEYGKFTETDNVYLLMQTNYALQTQELQSLLSFDYFDSRYSLYHPCKITKCYASINLQNSERPKIEYSAKGFCEDLKATLLCEGKLNFVHIGNTFISVPKTVKEQWAGYSTK